MGTILWEDRGGRVVTHPVTTNSLPALDDHSHGGVPSGIWNVSSHSMIDYKWRNIFYLFFSQFCFLLISLRFYYKALKNHSSEIFVAVIGKVRKEDSWGGEEQSNYKGWPFLSEMRKRNCTSIFYYLSLVVELYTYWLSHFLCPVKIVYKHHTWAFYKLLPT